MRPAFAMRGVLWLLLYVCASVSCGVRSEASISMPPKRPASNKDGEQPPTKKGPNKGKDGRVQHPVAGRGGVVAELAPKTPGPRVRKHPRPDDSSIGTELRHKATLHLTSSPGWPPAGKAAGRAPRRAPREGGGSRGRSPLASHNFVWQVTKGGGDCKGRSPFDLANYSRYACSIYKCT